MQASSRVILISGLPGIKTVTDCMIGSPGDQHLRQTGSTYITASSLNWAQ